MPNISVGRLVVSIAADLSKLMSGLKKSKSSLAKWSVAIGAMGKNLTKYVTAPMAAVGIGALKMSADFDKAMAKSTAIMGDLTSSMRGDLEQAARSVAKTTEFSATQAADAFYFLSSAGLDAAQSLRALPAVAKFATAGQFDLATATDLATDAQSALGMTIRGNVEKNAANLVAVTDALVKANTLANASVQQFSEALTNKAGPALRAVGKGIEEGLAVLAVYADQGIKGAEAGTQLGIVMRDLQTKAIKNAGAFRDMGVEVFDADGEMRNMADIIKDLETLMDGMSDMQRRAALSTLGFSDKSVSATLSLVGFSDAIRRYQMALEDAEGTTARVAGKQLRNLSSQFVMLWHRVQDVAITLGKALTPAALRFIAAAKKWLARLEELIKGFKQLPEWIKSTSALFAKLAFVAGPALLLISKILQFTLLPSVKNIGKAMAWLAANPVMLVITGVGILVNDVVELVKWFTAADRKTKDWSKSLLGVTSIADKYGDSLKKAIRDGVAKDPGLKKILGKTFEEAAEDVDVGEISLRGGAGLEALLKGGAAGFEELGINAKDAADGIDEFGDKAKQLDQINERIQAVREQFRGFGEMDLANAKLMWTEFTESLQLQMQDLVGGFINVFDTFTQGFSAAIANAIVYGESFKDAMEQVSKQVLAMMIQMLIRLGLEQLAYAIVSVIADAKRTAGALVAAATTTYAATYAAAVGPLTAMFLFGGPAAAAALAAAATAQMLAGAATSGGAGKAVGMGLFATMAEGGIVTQPMMALVGEAGPEAVIPLSQAKGMLGGDTVVILEADGRTLAKIVAPHLGGVLKKRIGARTI